MKRRAKAPEAKFTMRHFIEPVGRPPIFLRAVAATDGTYAFQDLDAVWWHAGVTYDKKRNRTSIATLP